MQALLPKLLLLLVSLFSTFAFIEMLLIPALLSGASIEMQAGFPHAMQILAQSSKRQLIPEDYVLLLGDSYAQGQGDWLQSVDKSGNPPFHSAHVLQEGLGRDVITYGRSGVGSIPGLALIPVRQSGLLARRGMAGPSDVLVYFDAGNDLDNNIGYLRRHYFGDHEAERLLDDVYFDAFLQDEVDRYVSDRALLDRYFTVSYVANLVAKSLEKLLSLQPPASPEPASSDPRNVNRIRVAGEVPQLPLDIQSPALDLTREETEWALHVFDRSVVYLKELYPDARIQLVYIPAPVATYAIESPEVSVRSYLGRPPLHPTRKVRERSKELRRRVQQIASEREVGFFDSTRLLRRAAFAARVHGPKDHQHLNEAGNRLLGEALVKHLMDGP